MCAGLLSFCHIIHQNLQDIFKQNTEFNQGAETSCVCFCTKRVCVRIPYQRCVLYVYTVRMNLGICIQSRRVHLFIVNFLLKNEFNMDVIYYLDI